MASQDYIGISDERYKSKKRKNKAGVNCWTKRKRLLAIKESGKIDLFNTIHNSLKQKDIETSIDEIENTNSPQDIIIEETNNEIIKDLKTEELNNDEDIKIAS